MITKTEENNTIPVKIQYAYANDISEFFVKRNQCFIVFSEGNNWIDFDSTSQTININTELKNTMYGVVPTSSIVFDIGGEDYSFMNEIYNLFNIGILFKVILNDGQEKILGTKLKPCYLNMKTVNQMNSIHSFSIQHNDIFRYNNLEDYPAGFSTGFSIGYNA